MGGPSTSAADQGAPQDIEANPIGVKRLESATGREAKFGTAEEEIPRILRLQKSYYAVLKVTKQSDAAELRMNHLRLSRIVHPDKCSLPEAAEASSIVNQAADTLRNSLKKALYDSYVEDVGPAEDTDLSYAEWEANAQRVEIPRWLERILRIPGGGICLLIVLLPFTLLLVLLLVILYVLCIPVRCVVLLCCGERPPPEHETEPSPTQQAAAPAGEPASKVQVPHSEPLIPADAAEERV